MNDKVSIVIACKNEELHIEKCLSSIKAQTWKNIEIIVVDNNSTDKTKQIAKSYTNNVYNYGPERSAQRNYGLLNIATGVYGIYIDADMILSPILIEVCVNSIKKEECTALYISEVILGKTYFSKVRRFERAFYNGTVIDGARFFNLNSLKEIGGFDEKLFQLGSGEDWDIDKSIKLTGRIKLIKAHSEEIIFEFWHLKPFIEKNGIRFDKNYVGIYHNESNVTLSSYLKKKKYYSIGFSGYIKKWGKNDPDIKKQFGFVYRYIMVFLENNKWKSFLKRPDLIFGLYVIRICVGFNYLQMRLRNE